MRPNETVGILSVYRPPLVYELTGRRFTLAFDDGYDRELCFRDRGMLSFGPAGEEKDYAYECLKAGGRCRKAEAIEKLSAKNAERSLVESLSYKDNQSSPPSAATSASIISWVSCSISR